MDRTIRIQLNKVAPVPTSLRASRVSSTPRESTSVNLGALFLQYYFDSYPTAPPKPDPSSFEYLDLVAASDDFRFHDFVAAASGVKRRAICTELGQAFCRLMLQDHFSIIHYAHMSEVLDKEAHPAFGGISIRRAASGDVPDYLCAGHSGTPFIAEAKGRFSSISFSSKEFQKWRDQFKCITVLGRSRRPRRTKGYIVGTRFSTTS